MAKDWKKDLGFLEGLMFDPVSMGVLGGLQGIMGMFGISEQNSKIDEISDEYKKMKLSEDQMARRQSETKRMYGSMVDSMIGAGQYLNSDTAKAVAMSKLTGQSMEAQLKQRMQDEQRNLQIDEQVTKLQANKKGYLEGIAGTLSGALQGVFSATQSSMAMDQKQEENDLLERLYGGTKEKVNSNTNNSSQTLDKLLETTSNADPFAYGLNQIRQYQNTKDRENYLLEGLKLKSELQVSDNTINENTDQYYQRLNERKYPTLYKEPELKLNLPVINNFDYFTADISSLSKFNLLPKKKLDKRGWL